mgnify:CR=1 FL=1
MSSIYAERAQCLKLYQLKIGLVLKVNFWIRFNICEFHTSKHYLIPFILYQKLRSLMFVCNVKCKVRNMTKKFQNVFDQTILWNFWFVCCLLISVFARSFQKTSRKWLSFSDSRFRWKMISSVIHLFILVLIENY